ncbi:MAG: ABC transporter ATP-binding protein [Planctomycetes bacterium]|nr:ABC transporter ATP-binding protein [Planctomycetota bacterium]
MSFIQIRALEKTWPDGTAAVRRFDLDIAAGEFTVLLGPSGCGKTTTLRMIAGLETPTSGKILLNGADVTHLPPSRRDVGFVFQFYALYPHMSVAENIAFPLACTGVARAERIAAVAEIAERLCISNLLNRRPRELPGGDQQRVALARAMIRKPAVWLMDEPLGTLDAELRAQLCEFIRARQIEARVATIYVTHDQDEAMRLADRVIVMNAGEILQIGAPSEMYLRPSSIFTARFVGSPGMNLIEGEVISNGGARAFAPRGGNIKLIIPNMNFAGPAWLGVRPEGVRCGMGATASGDLAGRIAVDAFAGSARFYHIDCAFGRVVARHDPGGRGAAGESVYLTFDPASICIFNAADGRRVS